MSEATIFERIATREIPANVVAETERVIAFFDIAPRAKLHVVVTPKLGTYQNVTELAAGDPALLAEIVAVAKQVADEHANGEYRLIFNTGASAGQTVFHVHAHVLSGDLEEQSLAR